MATTGQRIHAGQREAVGAAWGLEEGLGRALGMDARRLKVL
ncbi:MAG: hypothetical protein ACO2Z8_00935 [Burkholderiaceae bacterium]